MSITPVSYAHSIISITPSLYNIKVHKMMLHSVLTVLAVSIGGKEQDGSILNAISRAQSMSKWSCEMKISYYSETVDTKCIRKEREPIISIRYQYFDVCVHWKVIRGCLKCVWCLRMGGYNIRIPYVTSLTFVADTADLMHESTGEFCRSAPVT